MLLWLLFLPVVLSCSWNYRFDSYDNHFNIVYPDKNAVYFGMVIPFGSRRFGMFSDVHPISTYFSIQIYEQGGATTHYNDAQLLSGSGYNISVSLKPQVSYFALFRIYVPKVNYWGGVPPNTIVDGHIVPRCDIEYNQQGNIYTNLTYGIHVDTGTVCAKNSEFMFMDVPAGSLTNADANYMIACVSPAQYRIDIRMPATQENGDGELRYASISLVSTSAPRPTVWTTQITTNFSMEILVPNEVSYPAILYRQILPSPEFEHSIANAKSKCFDYVENKYDDKCISHVMGDYYPIIELI